MTNEEQRILTLTLEQLNERLAQQRLAIQTLKENQEMVFSTLTVYSKRLAALEDARYTNLRN